MKWKSLLSFVLLFTIIQTAMGQADKIYGLNFVGSELRFTSMDINTAEVEILSQQALSPDIFQSGVADFDPIEKRYFYVRGSGSNEQVFTVNALTGNIINNPVMTGGTTSGANTVTRLTNIAYNWLDGELYGLNHQYNGSEVLRLAKVELETGAVTMISDTPTSTSPYLSGNSDIDPVNRRYFYATASNIYTVDLDDGSLINSPSINYPMTGTQFTANLSYDWQNDIIYCLHFLSVPNPDPFSTDFTSELRLATIDPTTGEMILISNDITSNDGFSMGDCDIDPTGNRYFYVRQDSLYIVDLNDGSVIDQIAIENQNNAIAPIINMVYDDLTDDNPGDLVMDMGETIFMEPGQTMELNAWVGEEATYQWQDGSIEATLSVSEAGEYSVTITRDAFTIHGAVTVEMTPVSISELEAGLDFKIYPNPAQESLQYEINGADLLGGTLTLLDINGKPVLSKNISGNVGTLNVKSLSDGTYLLQYEAEGLTVSKKVLIVD